MTYKFEATFFEIIGNVTRYLKAQPLNLGGYMSSGGGQGGPPGGYFGQLPQTRVTYDLSELSSSLTPSSGASLLDNLNHIRYRLDNVEGSGSMGVDVLQDGITVAEGVHTLDFLDRFTVTTDGLDTAFVSLLASGVQTDVTYSGVFGENLTSQIGGTHFDTANIIYNSSLAVYLNGIRQSASGYTIDGDYTGFTTNFIPISGDTLTVDYVVVREGYYHTHSQYVTTSGAVTPDQLSALLANKADLIHTHTVSDITGLSDPLVVNQQIIFTIAGSGVAISGVKPLRIYAHDVNDSAEITEIFVAFNTPPDAETHLNVLKNSATIFASPAYMIIASGAYTTSRTTDISGDAFVKDDCFQISVEQTNAVAQDMTLHIRFSYEL